MESNLYNTGMFTDDTTIFPSGMAYVVIPSDTERNKHINECYKTSTVSIYSVGNGLINRVPVDINSLNFIRFPKMSGELGSKVSFVEDVVKRPGFISGVFLSSSELSLLQENQFRFKKSFNEKLVEVFGDAGSGKIGMNVSTNEAGEIFLNVRSLDKSGKAKITVDGNIELEADNSTTISQKSKLEFITTDLVDITKVTHSPTEIEETTLVKSIDAQKINENADEKTIQVGKLIINKGEENFVLGQLLKSFIKELVTEISNATVTTNTGVMPLNNKLNILEFIQDKKIDEFLSKVAYLDK